MIHVFDLGLLKFVPYRYSTTGNVWARSAGHANFVDELSGSVVFQLDWGYGVDISPSGGGDADLYADAIGEFSYSPITDIFL